MRFFPWNNIDPDAAAYIANVQAAGVTDAHLISIGLPTWAVIQPAINTFYKTGKSDGWYSSLKRLYLPIWGVAAANAICLRSLTSGTFVGSVTHGAGFVLSDTTTGYMDTNVGLTTLGLSLSSYHFAGLYKASSGRANSYLFGAASGSNTSRMFVSGTTYNADLSSPTLGRAAGTVASGDRLGIFTFSGAASSRFLKRRKTSGVTTLGSTTTTITAQPNNLNVAFLAHNTSGVVSNFCGEEIGAFSIGLELTDAQDTAYSLALKSLWEGTTGLTLP
jgi:hypothetical protein